MLEEPELPGIESPNAELQALIRKCNELKELSDLIKDKDAEIARLQEQEKELSLVTIPRMMESLGIDELGFANGCKVSLKEEIFASIRKDLMPSVVAWLREKNMAGMVKTECFIPPEQAAVARAASIPVTESHSIHHQTLKSFVKEQMALDPTFPKDMFGVSQRDVAVMKRS